MLQDYLLPTTVEAALIMLKKHAGHATLIAGGTDLILQEEKSPTKAAVLVDISRIHELRHIEKQGDALLIGAGVTHTQAATSQLVKTYAPALATACSVVGGKQIRNIGTLGGNLVTAQPAADGAVALAGLGAVCHFRSSDGCQQEKLLPELYAGIGKSKIDSRSQIITHFTIPLSKNKLGSSYQRIDQRKALSLPMLCVALRIELSNDTIRSASIVFGPASPGPRHASEAEAFLINKHPEEKNFTLAAEIAAENAEFRTSPVRGSKEFRMHILPICIARGLRDAAHVATRHNV